MAQSPETRGQSRPTPRRTRLARVPALRAFRPPVIGLATMGSPVDARDRMVVVPTRAAASLLVRSIHHAVVGAATPALGLSALAKPRELVARLSERLDHSRPVLTPAQREVLLGVACRLAHEQGAE